MRLDPRHELGAAAVDLAMDVAFAGPTAEVDEPTLTRFALGVADAAAALACSRAILRSASVRRRLMEIRSRLSRELGDGDGAPAADVVARAVEGAKRVDRLVAEGMWSSAETVLRDELPLLRLGWRLAADDGDHASVEEIVRRLIATLAEAGEWDAFDDLACVGSLRYEALGETLRRHVLSYQGVAAARRGDLDGADRFWLERLRLAREAGHAGIEADTLLDLAGTALDRGDPERFSLWVAEAKEAADRAGDPILEATYWGTLAKERAGAGDLESAALHARRSLGTLAGAGGLVFGLFVRANAARTLVRCGRRSEGRAALVDLLEACAESGRTINAARLLGDLGEIAADEGRRDLAARCLVGAWRLDAALGARRLAESWGRLAAFGGAPAGAEAAWPDDRAGWTEAILTIVEDFRGSPTGVR